MGQSQSTGSKGQDTPAQELEQKTDYYELLGITRGATDDEIKKAYRKKALALHPDRNYGNVEEATRLFAEIQSAYEVLADPQERAWYDSHSEVFLGTNGASEDQHSYNIRVTTAEDVLKVFSKFSPRMEFSDSPSGFFGGLQEQFAQLALEERLACQWEDQDVVDYPVFGSRDDDFETVVRPFYAAWSGFSTCKSFAWKDAYRLSEAPDRRVRRMMEKENRRLREEGIREFNDAIRSLVAFVKKRDPRYKANAQSDAQRQETLRQSVAAQAARSRAQNQAKMTDYVLPEWARSEEQVIDEDEESSESEIESFECVACNKQFKSQKQFEAHERSKKHLKAVKQLCREMRMENVELDLEPSVPATISPEPASTSFDAPSDEGNDDHIAISSIQPQQSIGESVGSDSQAQLSEKHMPISDDYDSKSSPQDSQPRRDSLDSVDEDYASRESVETRLRSDLDSSLGNDPIAALTDQFSSADLGDKPPVPPQVGKAKQRRAKKAARGSEPSTGISCTNCQASFTSKTKLFAHLKDNPSHAQPLKATIKSKKR
ncbi:DnaJ subfamily C member 21 [Penicillium rolfsii]|nr:DnaJ subfamily C member 21 [Penicillium rolfsii]